ncbi:MAG TPA: hypothetical protein VMW27_20320 [Thermoanaerobaculia bacterium]|nr:hypothetical protein [Thermoanaerobaculia bacterium]
MWLGESRGNLIDWSTQKWVQTTGRSIDLAKHPWLAGPIGSTRGIGLDYFDKWAAAEGLRVQRHPSGKGLLPSFAALSGDGFDPAGVGPAVAEFYERAADFDLDVWSQWCGLFQPFGLLIAAVFSRRLQQLNLPLSALDSSWGMTSEVIQVADPATGELRANAWVRTLVKTRRIVYVGSYSVACVPGAAGPCVKTVFPLPNGNAVVLLRPSAQPDGSLLLVSQGKRFGDPGFYFTVHGPRGSVRARYVKNFCERIHVYPADGGVVRADHTMSLYGLQCLHLHYRLRPKEGRAAALLAHSA